MSHPFLLLASLTFLLRMANGFDHTDTDHMSREYFDNPFDQPQDNFTGIQTFGTYVHQYEYYNLPTSKQPSSNKTSLEQDSGPSQQPAGPPSFSKPPETSTGASSSFTNGLVLGLSFGIVGVMLAALSMLLVYRRHKRLAREKKRIEDLEGAKETDEDFVSGDDEDGGKESRAPRYQSPRKKSMARDSGAPVISHKSKTLPYEDSSFAVNHIEYLRKCLSSGDMVGHTDLMNPSLSAQPQPPATMRASVTSYRVPSYSDPYQADLSMPTPRAIAGPAFYQDIFDAEALSEATSLIPFAPGFTSQYTDAYDAQLPTVLEESLSSHSHASQTPSPLSTKTPPRPTTPLPEYAMPSPRAPSPIQAGGDASEGARAGIPRSVSPMRLKETRSPADASSPVYLAESPLSQHRVDSDPEPAEAARPSTFLASKASASHGPPRPRRKVVKRGKLGSKGNIKGAASRKVSTESIALYEAMDMI